MQYEVLVRMQKNWNPHTLLLSIQNGVIALENSLSVFLRIKHSVNIRTSNSQENIKHTFCILRLIAALFIIAMKWKQPECASADV